MVLGLFVILTKTDARNFSQITEKVRKTIKQCPSRSQSREGHFLFIYGEFRLYKALWRHWETLRSPRSEPVHVVPGSSTQKAP